MILLKVALTIAIVTTLSIVAERVSPRVAGILSGYPLGSAIALFFIGLEQGAAFAAHSAVYNIAGLAALLSFFFIYFWVSSQKIITGRIAGILIASSAGMAAFFAVDALLHMLPLPGWACALVGVGAITAYAALFRGIPNTTIRQQVHLGLGVVLFRAGLAALTILAITGAANLVPPSWAGLFSAFPITAFPLVLIVHSTYGPEQAHSIIKNIPTGLWALVLYLLTIAYCYPRLGIFWGTLIGFGVATMYLLGLSWLHRKRS